MKIVKIFLLCIILTACSSTTDLNTQLDNIFTNNVVDSSSLNNYGDYIDYYLPFDLHEEEADKLNFIFSINESKIVMNINVASIINHKYYTLLSLKDEGFFDEDKLVYTNKGTYLNKDNKNIKYIYDLYAYEDTYLAHLESVDLNVYAYIAKEDVEIVTLKMFNLLKSAVVDEEKIIANFSSKDVIDYQKSVVNLFEEIMPVSGRVDDMMIEDK